MKPHSTVWKLAEKIPADISEKLNGYSSVFRQILFNRGISSQEEAELFLGKGVFDDQGEQLLGIQEGVARIKKAISTGEQIAVYGDYDADGVTSTALIVQTLLAVNANVRAYIPDRFSEGYGLNVNALDMLKSQGISLVVTVDCGIRALHQAEHAEKIGIDLIITDHHTPGEVLPKVPVLINPKQPGDLYPEKYLAGVGVAYKLAQALIAAMPSGDFQVEQLLDLVAIGTVADMVPLKGENRVLVQQGLGHLRMPRRQGVVSLMGISGTKPERVSAMDIGFGLGPRINAAGRIASALDAYQLLVTDDVFEAGKFAQILDNRNRERQRITQEIQEKAEELTQSESEDAYLVFAYHPDFNPGVVGLAASRLVEQHYKPAVVGFQGEEFTRASCRSIPEFNITKALEQCADLLVQYGGHAAAAGFTVSNDKLDLLNERLQSIAKTELAGESLHPKISIDAEVKLEDLKPSLLQEMAQLEPTGMENPSPVFSSRNVIVRGSKTVGREGAHLKLTLSDGRITFDAIAFRLGFWNDQLPEQIDIAFSFELNEFMGRQTLQLNIKDIKQAA
ncbi:MAG: single-stranded-DNA-specific exonuclease RecJ [Chloroflexota bacterium]